MSFIICFDIATSVITTVIVVVYNPFNAASKQIPAPASDHRPDVCGTRPTPTMLE